MEDLSFETVTTIELSLLITNLFIYSVWTAKITILIPVYKSHIMAVLSFEPVTTFKLSGLTANVVMPFVWKF